MRMDRVTCYPPPKKKIFPLVNGTIVADGQQVLRSEKVTTLGVWIDDKLTWLEHTAAVEESVLSITDAIASGVDIIQPSQRDSSNCSKGMLPF